MLCPKCGHAIRLGAKFCHNCGAAVEIGGAPAAVRSDLAGLADSLSSSLRETSEALSRSLGSVPGLTPSGAGAPGSLAGHGVAAGRRPSMGVLARAAEGGSEAEAVIRMLLTPTVTELEQSASFMFKSSFIQGNVAYRDRVGRVTFVYDDEDPTVNAFATDQPIQTHNGRSVAPPLICFDAGLATTIRLIALALAAQLTAVETRAVSPGVSLLAGTFRAFGKACIEGRGKFTMDMAVAVFAGAVLPTLTRFDEHTLSLGQSYVAAMESFVIAHEAGHIALSHTLRQHVINLEISRNQEREADSFGASTLSSCPFRDYLFLGSVFVTIIFCWMDEVGGNHSATSHPLGRERFENALRSNSEAAAEAAARFGFTREHLLELLPAV